VSRERPPGWLPEAEFRQIFRKVTRMCVEVVVADPASGVLLALREIPPNVGAWHIPGGTVLWGERVHAALRRIAREEIGLDVEVGELLGYIEYPSHYENGIDSPVGLAFHCTLIGDPAAIDPSCRFFGQLPDGLYAEQDGFLRGLGPPFSGAR
jgi:8-oxo-dGTP pyrophosphatase MutT (NUDIX family)